jgi:hypothetical protein
MTALKCVRELNKRITPPIVGDFYYKDAHTLRIWFIFADQRACIEADTVGHCARIQQQTLEALREADYPAGGLNHVEIGFEGDKEIMDGGGY